MTDAVFFPPAQLMKNKRDNQQPVGPIGFKPESLKAAGRMMIGIALSTGAILLSAVFLGTRLDRFFGMKPALKIVCCVIGVIGSAWINFRIALKTAARLGRRPETADANQLENERSGKDD